MGIYYNPSRLLSQRCIFNFIIGNRGGGKTYGWQKRSIKRFLKKGKQFIWCRRYQTEIDTLTTDEDKNFFSAIRQEFPEHEFAIAGDRLLVDGQTCGFLVALSTSAKLKSVPFPNVETIILDEFIIDKGRVGYLKNEAQVFLELFETVFRTRDDGIAVFIGNAISIVNPYFTFFKMTPDLNKRFTKDMKKSVCIEFYFNEEFIKQKESTRFGRAIKDTDYGQYNMRNKFLRDTDAFIAARPITADMKCFQFIIDGQKYSLWKDRRNQNYYIDKNYENNFGHYRTLVLNPNDMQDNDESMCLFKKTHVMYSRLQKMIEVGNLYFDSQNSKQEFYQLLC